MESPHSGTMAKSMKCEAEASGHERPHKFAESAYETASGVGYGQANS